MVFNEKGGIKMLKYNVFFKIDTDIEISVIVVTASEERDRVIYEARKKLEDRGYDEFSQLECTAVDFLEEV
jgi:hypothetical protein